MRSSLKGINPEWVTLSGEDGEDDPVQFRLKPLDGIAWTTVLMDSYNPETGEVGGSGVIRAFKIGVVGWRGIEDADNPGKELPFSISAMGKINPGWIMEIGNKVMELSRIGESDSKNLD